MINYLIKALKRKTGRHSLMLTAMFTVFLSCFFVLTSLVTAHAADTDVIRNGDFSKGLNQWVLNLKIDPAWNPVVDGWVNLHPPVQGIAGFTDKVIYQNLNVSGISGKTFHFSMDMLKVNAPTGKTISVKIWFTKTDGTVVEERIVNPSNGNISGDPNNPSNVTADYTFPADASKLVRIAVVKENFGEFRVDNIKFTAAGITAGSIPAVTDISTPTGLNSGPYGSSLTITGKNFGNTAGSVTIAGTKDGIEIKTWSSTSITVTVSDPARSGAVRIISNFVESDPKFRFNVTSPNYTVDVIDDYKTAIKGQNIEFLFKVNFNNAFTTQNGISLSLLSSSPAIGTGSFSFLPGSPLKEPGGAVLRINTSNLSNGEYDLTIQASEAGSHTREIHCRLKVVTISKVNFFENNDPLNTIAKKTITKQAQFYLDAVAVDSDGKSWESTVLDFKSGNAGKVQIFNAFWGPQFYAVDNTDANTPVLITATAPDGTKGTLAVTIALDINFPKITSLSLSPGSIANTDTATPLTLTAQCDHALDWIGTDTSGMDNFKTTFQNPDTGTHPDEYSTYTNNKHNYAALFHLTNPPTDLGTPVFTVSSGASHRVVPLNVTNGTTTGEIKGKIKILDNTFAEAFTLEFYDPENLSSPVFTRKIFAMHEKSSFDLGGIPPGTYKIKLKGDEQQGGKAIFTAQWYPDSITSSGAGSVAITAGNVTKGIYFFLRSSAVSGISGAVSYGDDQTGTIRVNLVDTISQDDNDAGNVNASANGQFYFKNVPDGVYSLYAYLDSDNNKKYTAGEPFGYYLASDGSTGTITIANGNPATNIFVTIKTPNSATGIAGTITSSLSTDDFGSVVLFSQGKLPVNVNINDIKGDFLNPLIGVDLAIAHNAGTPYRVESYNWGNGPPVPPGTYDVALATSGTLDPDGNVVVRGVIPNVKVEDGKITNGIDFSISPGQTLKGKIQSDAPTPFPLVNANIMLFSGTQTNATFEGFGTTDSTGSYEMQNVPAGTYFLVVRADGFEDLISTPLSITAGQPLVKNVSMKSKTGYGQVKITITDSSTGQPIAGEQRAYILLPNGDTPTAFLQPVNNQPGVFSSYVLPGSYNLMGSARGYKPFFAAITIAKGSSITKAAALEGPANTVINGVNWLLNQQNPDGSFGPVSNDPYIMGWSGYAALALLSIRDNPKLGLNQTLIDKINNALDDAAATDGKKGAKQYFLGLYQDKDDPQTSWNDTGSFVDDDTLWSSVAATPVALERLIALGLPLNDPKVAGAVKFLLNAQVTALKAWDPMFAGGWRYSPTDTDTDNWETPWVIMALMKAGLNPAEPHVKAGINLIRRSQFTTGDNAGLFRYMPGEKWPVSGASAACMTALGFAGVPRTDTAVDLYFKWAKAHPSEIHANSGPASDCYYWSMLSWAASLYPDKTAAGKTEYETLGLTWNIADYVYMNQNTDGSWNNPAPTSGGSQSANSVMFTASALMALAPHTAALAPPKTKSVSGTIYDDKGNTIEGAGVEARLNGVTIARTETDKTGNYNLHVPENQAYTLRASSNGYARVFITTGAVTNNLTKQDISFESGDKDDTLPNAGSFVPADGSIIDHVIPEISAILGDDHSGIDPDSIVMKLDGTQVYAVYNVMAIPSKGKLTFIPSNDMENGVHKVTIDYKDYARNKAVQAAWSFTLDIWRKVPGDVNNNGKVDLPDLISSLKIITGRKGVVIAPSHSAADVNGDGKIGLPEAGYILQSVTKPKP